jgi:hypothetical protein
VVALPVGACSTSSAGSVGFVRVGEAARPFCVSATFLAVFIVVAPATGLAVIEGDLLGEAIRLLTAALATFAPCLLTDRSVDFASSITLAFSAAPLLSSFSAYRLGLERLAGVVCTSSATCDIAVLARALGLEEGACMYVLHRRLRHHQVISWSCPVAWSGTLAGVAPSAISEMYCACCDAVADSGYSGLTSAFSLPSSCHFARRWSFCCVT